MRLLKRVGDVDLAVKLAKHLYKHRAPRHEAIDRAAAYYGVKPEAVTDGMRRR